VDSISILKYGSNDIVFIYSDSSKQKLYYKTFRGNTPSEIWSTSDTTVNIKSVSASLDSENKLHICFGTDNPDDDMDPAYYTITGQILVILQRFFSHRAHREH